MTYIIGLGAPTDPKSLALETRAKRRIANVLRPEMSPVIMRVRIALHTGLYPRARPLSGSAIYNCFGLAFAARRSAIVDEQDVAMILEDDGYQLLPWDPLAWHPTDVVIYRNDKGSVVHVGLIAEVAISPVSNGITVWVVSAWGDSGEYLHPIDHLPELLGRPSEVRAQRFLYDS